MSAAQPTPERAPIADDISAEELIARYLAGPALVRATIAGMDADQLHARPIEGKMSTHDVVTHIADSEAGLGGRLKRALAGEEPLATQGGHPEAVSDPTRDLSADLEQLTAAREQMGEALRHIEPDVWERIAARWGEREVTVRQMLLLMTRHLENHVATIEEKRAALGL
ncbi:MAG: DinB family protein [Coriobacteriia bacterium]|nr:DinB family protein [Coriobacteriia bacterium]